MHKVCRLTSSCWKDIACCKGSLGMEQLLWWTLLWRKINPNLTIVWKGWKCTKKPNHIFMNSQTHKGTVDVSKWTGCLIPCLEIFRCGWQRGDTLEMMLHSKAGKAKTVLFWIYCNRLFIYYFMNLNWFYFVHLHSDVISYYSECWSSVLPLGKIVIQSGSWAGRFNSAALDCLFYCIYLD